MDYNNQVYMDKYMIWQENTVDAHNAIYISKIKGACSGEIVQYGIGVKDIYMYKISQRKVTYN